MPPATTASRSFPPPFSHRIEGSFRMTGRTPRRLTDEQLRGPAEIFRPRRRNPYGTAAPAVTTRTAKNAVTLRLAPGFDTEEYLLEVTKKGIIAVTASTPAGGTARAPEPSAADRRRREIRPASSATNPCSPTAEPCSTYAATSSRWRTSNIDILSLHKINKFHWHLTDDQGWRIEIGNIPG